MYVSYSEQLKDYHGKYHELLQEWLELEIEHEKERIHIDTFRRLRGKILSEQNEVKRKMEMYKYYDIFDLILEIEFRKLSDHLV